MENQNIYNFPFKRPFSHQSVKGNHPVQLKCVLNFHDLSHEVWSRMRCYVIACGKANVLKNCSGYAFTSGSEGGRCFIEDRECMCKLYFYFSFWAHLWTAVEINIWRHAHGCWKKARLLLNAMKSFEVFNVLVRAEKTHCGCWSVSASMSHAVWHHVFTCGNRYPPGFLPSCLCRLWVSSWTWVTCRLLLPEANGRERSAI